MDGYNWGTTQTIEKNRWSSKWRTFSEIFLPLFQELRQLNASYPLFIFEVSSVEEGGNRQQWIEEALMTCHQWDINAIFWFYANKEENWKVKDLYSPLITTDKEAQAWITSIQLKRHIE
jgi:mannan endo-1,4-beta-mannosidase